MGKEAAILLFFGVSYLRVCFAASLNGSSSDESSLLALKAQINSDILSKNWSQETSFCKWIGVSCSRRHPRVIGLDLSDMGLQGTIAREIGNLSFLVFLDISNNNINGRIPREIGNLRRLRVLYMTSNKLSDHIPESLGLLRKLERLNLSNNYLNGGIPRSLSACVEINMLDMSSNNLTGNIPIGFGNLSQLQYLSLRSNMLTGEIPSTILNTSSLLTINVVENQMYGSIPKDICSQPATKLEELRLDFNQFEGEILPTLMHCHSLKRLSLRNNKFTGKIPDELWNLSSIEWVVLRRNEFKGTIAPSVGNLSNLERFDIGENSFHGTVPSELGQLSSLTFLSLQLNKLNGELPQSVFNLSKLEIFSVAYDNLSGSLPFSIDKGLPNIQKLYLGGEIGNMKGLIELDLSRNRLSGEIPSTISQLQNLFMLSLSNNILDGPIIESFADLKGLQYLDLSHNNLSGPIPRSLQELAYLNYFNVSFNELSGEIPDRGAFVNFTAEFFIGNKDLCGAPRFKVKACRRSIAEPSSNIILKYILPVISSVVVAGLILIVVLVHRGRKLSPSSLSNSPLGLTHERISHLEILRATSNLDEENLIGRGSFGSVYKGNFSDALVAAVKVFNLDVQGALKSFDIECQIMSSIRHRNLVKVITSCSNLEFKALVMAYIPNGNLEKWLYSVNNSLNIFQRLGIMKDVASALEYLHEGYTYPIVHCDLKPSNILLDQDMVAHVGDFGIAKLLTEEQRMQQTRTLGTIGYMAPEYGSQGLVSTMVDAYSYGILLMEVFLRRKPIDKMFSGELTMKKWVFESFPSSIMQIVDDELLNMADESAKIQHKSCLTSIIGLALECTADLPQERPAMKDVLARIKKIKLNLSNHNKGRCS